MIKRSEQQRVAYTGLRDEVISLIKNRPLSVLDVGCSNGVLLEYLKSRLGVRHTVGIELDQELANEASGRVDKVINADLDSLDSDMLGDAKFDLIVLADVLEHTKEPVSVLQKVIESSTQDAQIIVSVPNIQHWTVIKNLLIGEWPQRERGIFDKTHLRFFTLASIRELASRSGLEIEKVVRNYRLVDANNSKINRLSRLLALGPLKPYLTYQYVVSMRRVRS